MIKDNQQNNNYSIYLNNKIVADLVFDEKVKTNDKCIVFDKKNIILLENKIPNFKLTNCNTKLIDYLIISKFKDRMKEKPIIKITIKERGCPEIK